jgi:CIC family chloride channel protein
VALRKSKPVQGDLERVRVPAPILRRRLPSRRGATEQPNASGDGDTPLTLRFWAALLVTGVATGVAGDLLMWLLFAVQHAAFDYHSGELTAAVARAGNERRVVALVAAGAIAGPGWWLLRRFTHGMSSDVDHEIWSRDADLSLRSCIGSGVLSEIVIGMGASIGREQAPKAVGAASGSALARWFGLTREQRRLLVACGAGAGLAAVYNVPLGGSLFTCEIILGSLALPVVLPVTICTLVATATGWIYLPHHATYVDVPNHSLTWTIGAIAVATAPFIGLASAAYIRLIGWVTHHTARGIQALFAPLAAFTALGVIGIRYPELFGNGKDMAHTAFLGGGTLGLLLALAALKPLVTAACLQSSATGGLFTPVMSTGAVLGGATGIVVSHLAAGVSVGAFAMIGSAAMIGAAMQAPLSGVALVLELTHSGFGLMVPMLAATAIATLVARMIDGYSIYTARLPAATNEAGRTTSSS